MHIHAKSEINRQQNACSLTHGHSLLNSTVLVLASESGLMRQHDQAYVPVYILYVTPLLQQCFKNYAQSQQGIRNRDAYTVSLFNR